MLKFSIAKYYTDYMLFIQLLDNAMRILFYVIIRMEYMR